MQVLGIVGSPRHNGNTDSLVDEILTSAQDAGAVTKKVVLNDLNISPCQACNGCRDTNECVQDDDMSGLLELMKNSEIWILGTPVYWWGPTAQFKTFLDRWYGIERSIFHGRRIILAVPSGGGRIYSQYTVSMLTDIIDYLRMVHIATVLAPGLHRRGAVRNHPEILQQARNAGRKAVEML